MKKSVTKNYIYNLIYQLLLLILPLITTPYVSRILGAENIGIYSFTISVTTFFVIFGSLGVATYGQREVAYYQNDKKKYSKTFWEIVIFRIITMSISMIVFCFVFIFRNNDYSMFYKILLLELFGNAIDISWFFQGMEDFKKIVLRNSLVKLISIICVFAFVREQGDLVKYFFIYGFSVLVGYISIWFYLPKYLERVKIKELRILRHLKPTIGLFIPQIAIQVYTLLDKTMIGGIISDKSEVGYYEQGQKIIKVLLTVVTSLGTVMLPRIASIFANGDKEKIQEYMKKSFNMVYLLAFPMIFGIIAVSKAFVPVFFGNGYDRVAILMNVISPILLFVGLSNVTGMQFLLPTKRQKEFTISVFGGAIVNLIINGLLIWKLGAIGASIGTIVAEFTVTLVQIYYTRNDFNYKEIIFLSWKYLFSSLVMFGVCLVIGHFITRNIVSVMVQVVVGASVYGISLLVLKDKFIYEVINRFLRKSTEN